MKYYSPIVRRVIETGEEKKETKGNQVHDRLQSLGFKSFHELADAYEKVKAERDALVKKESKEKTTIRIP